jgi:hypothetical protein
MLDPSGRIDPAQLNAGLRAVLCRRREPTAPGVTTSRSQSAVTTFILRNVSDTLSRTAGEALCTAAFTRDRNRRSIVGAMMRPRRRGRSKAAETAPEEGAASVQTEEEAAAEEAAGLESAPVPEPAAAPPAPNTRRYIINLNMLSNVDVKFYTEGESQADVIGRWRNAVGRAKRERPEETVEVVMGSGDGSTSYVLYLAEVTAFAIGPSVIDPDAIDCTVNV